MATDRGSRSLVGAVSPVGVVSEVRELFAADALRTVVVATAFDVTVKVPTVVLGSRQPATTLNALAVEREKVEVRRRRGGGGAVLLRSDDTWLELWLPAGVGPTGPDLRATACRVGEWWSAAFEHLGVGTEVHRGAVARADQGAVACFAGLGPGELSVDGRKLLGLSQWRTREGTLISCVAAADSPGDLEPYLATPESAPSLREAISLAEAAPAVTRDVVVGAIRAVVTDALGALASVSDSPH
jgi:lipoate---protein ligase